MNATLNYSLALENDHHEEVGKLVTNGKKRRGEKGRKSINDLPSPLLPCVTSHHPISLPRSQRWGCVTSRKGNRLTEIEIEIEIEIGKGK